MAHQSSGQPDFADSFLGNNKKLNQRFDELDRIVDWNPFEEKLNRIYSFPSRRPSLPVLLLFKCLLLQAWYNLSDYGAEEALDDRLSFRRFVGLSVSQKAPDHLVFSQFRDQLIRHGIHDQLFNQLDHQLEKRGLVLKRGTLLDGTVIEAARKKPKQNKDGTPGKSLIAPEADWT